MRLSRHMAAYLSVFSVFFISGVDVSQAEAVGSWIKTGVTALVIVLALAFYLNSLNSPKRVINQTGLYWVGCLFALAGFSIAWSINLPATGITFVAWIYTFCAAYLLIGLGLQSAMAIIVISFAWLCAISLVLSLAWSDAFMLNHGVMRFRGLFYGPHALARPAAICLCIIASGVLLVRRPVLFALALIIGVSLLLTFSRQAIAAAMVSVVIALFMRVRTYSHIAVIGFISAILVIGLSSAYMSGYDLAEIASRGEGDDVQSLTGRTFIWEATFDLIWQKPFLGYGFGAGGIALQDYYSAGAYNWTTYNAHNAFLQILLDLGVVGLILLLIMLGYWLARSISIFPVLLFPAFICVVLLSFVERGFYGVGGIIPLVFMLALLARNQRMAKGE
ncbi:MAG TPA: O-antigen ligase family protein [Nitrosomonas mobilis]|nr:O-antigen ligase family protein [Nitrosomonas mobilis]